MTEVRVSIDFVFETEYDEDFDYTGYRLVRLERTDSTLPDNAVSAVQETWAQSDFGWVELPSAVHGVIGSKVVRVKR
jgi:hypothetical protein